MESPGRKQRHWLRTGWRPIRWLLAAYLIIVLIAMFLEESLIFFPFNCDDDDWNPSGIDIEDVRFQAADGTRLHGWYVPHEEPLATVLFCHGNAGNLSHRIETLRRLHDDVGVSVMIFDYRGYGQSEGKPNEPGVLADARAARHWLAQREKIDEKEIVMMGRSLGAAVACDLAVADGARGLILESAFTSIPDVAAHYYPWLPVRLIMRTRLDSRSKIGDYHGPLLQSHGKPDSIIPFKFGHRLFEAANEPKQFIAFPDCDHNDPHPEEYFGRLRQFFERLD